MNGMEKTNLNRTIRGYYGFQLFFNLILWVPVFYAVQKTSGLTDTEIFGIQSIYYIAFVLFEIPTGYLADRMGYRTSMALGAGVFLAANLWPIAWSTYAGFLTHFLLIALSRSLISGAASAYLYDFLVGIGDKDRYKAIEGRARSLGLFAKIFGWSTVGFAMELDYFAPYWLSALSALLALGFVAYLPALKPIAARAVGQANAQADKKKPNGAIAMWTNFGTTLASVYRSKILLLVMLQGIGLFVLARINQVNLFQPILTSKGFAVGVFGWIMAGMTIAEAIGASISPSLRRYFDDKTAVFALTITIAASFVGTALAGGLGTIAAFLLFSLCSGLAFPIQRQLLNDNIDGSSRATVLSIESVINRSASALAVWPLGGLVAAGKLDSILIGAALITWTGVVLVYTTLRFQTRSRVARSSGTDGSNDATAVGDTN